MNFSGIKLFRIFGIEINLDYSWFIAFFLITITLAEGFYPSIYPDSPKLNYYLVSILSAFALFISVLLHELSHSLVAIRYGIPVKDIYLFIFGGVALFQDEPKTSSQEFKIALAGPLMSFFLASLFFTIVSFYPKNDLFNGFLNYVFMVNFFLGAFNLIPAFPLDGGRIFRSILWHKYGILKATEIASKLGNIFGIILILIGIFSLFTGNVVNGIWLSFLGFFIKRASREALMSTKLNYILSKFRVENIMNVMNPVPAQLPLLEFITYERPITRLYPVLLKDGRILFLDTRDLTTIPYYKQEELTLTDVAKPIDIYVSPDERLSRAYSYMRKNNLEEIPVKYNNTFLGILRRSDIEDIITRFLRDINESSNHRRR
ncbi:site-2 protease family protein [Sulfurihydrogenibium subterraneum]|uniref:site-2 protease family protein n=1 Tax=Sulfurihydrogenibium subterraneum TaxID=171121 RepID=UPI00048C952D|nr:site-2 protease family protein [Sulfurihydrogenibium subterraneum]